MADGDNTRWWSHWWSQTQKAVVAWSIGTMAVLLAITFGVVAGFQSIELQDHHLHIDPTGPNWAEIATGIGTVVLALATLVLAGAAIAALRQIGEARRVRNAQVAIDAFQRWNDEGFRRVRAEVDKAANQPGGLKTVMLGHREAHSHDYRRLLMEPDYFEDLGILIKYQAIDFRIVRDSLGTTVVHRWSQWKPFIDRLREEPRNRIAFCRFQELAGRIEQAEAADERG
jgi:hypothetical protein